MALGNSNSAAQARGKNKPVEIRRTKEIFTAKNYSSITSSPVQSSAACRYSGSLSETFYHNGARALPATNDIIYSTKRADSRTVVAAGHYKIQISSSSYSIQVGSSGIVSRVDSCR
tara:strand:- start:1148 stop:1495 length:348 start_codon:yes stop_codon:yes gene_type:complete